MRSIAFPTTFNRLLLLLTGLVVIVGAGYFARRTVSNHTVEALRWVSHTQEVRASVFELTSSLHEMEAAALAIGLNSPPGSARARYDAARARHGDQLDALRNLTRDSAEQQERIGMLRSRIADRVALFDRVTLEQTDFTRAAAASQDATTRFPVDDITNAILAREAGLLRSRQENADREVRQSRWVSLVSTLDEILMLGAIIWVSDRQMGRRVVAESGTLRAVGRARLIVETVREPIAVIAADLTCLQANQAFADFYGLTRPFKGSLTDVEGWSEDAALQQKLRDVSTTQRELWDYETLQRTVGDVERNVIVNARPMILPDTSDTVALLTVSDLTAHKRSEAQILELNRQLAGKIAQITEVNRELEAFSYSVSHDLRAPLRHIAGFSEKLRTGLGDAVDDKVKHYCDVITDSARRMSTLIEDLLSYSRLGRHALRLQPVDMQSLVEEVRAVLMSNVEGREITWRLAPLPVVIADAATLQLAWQNLLDNAIKYTAGKENAVIEIGTDDIGEERVFWVRDNGAGFDMRYVDKLFGVFQRLHKASAFSGSGIGLASVRRIIARHGGRTWAEGVPEQGSTFFFSLPRHGINY